MNVRRSNNGSHLSPLPTGTESVGERSILCEEAFLRMIANERKRTERSRKPFLLMLLDMGEDMSSEKSAKTLGNILSVLAAATRETDVTGWYKNDCVVGAMFTEISGKEHASLLSTMISRVSETLRDHLRLEQFNQINISFHVFPEDWDQEFRKRLNDPILYPDLCVRANSNRLLSATKRVMDVAGSLLALILLSPLFLVIAAAIKSTSKGPIFFRQRRVGQCGEAFTFLKFRSMDENNDASIHREYVKELIAGRAVKQPSNGNGDGHFKLTQDPRITRIGSFLRKTSLDELPPVHQCLDRQDVAGRSTPPHSLRSGELRRLASSPLARSETGHHRFVAGQRTKPREVRRYGSPGSAIRQHMVSVDGYQDPAAHTGRGRLRRRRLLINPPSPNPASL